VVGRGARAAAVMGQLRTAMRAYALQQLPATVLMRSLDLLLQDVSDSALATAACVMLDPKTGELELVLAGHPPPLVLEPSGTARFLRGDAHTPMGVRPAPLYLSSFATLKPGSTLLIFTDGLVESRTRALGEGLDLLARTLGRNSFAADVDSLCDFALETMIADRHDDDVAVLAVRFGIPG
jgi:serine phosphatase RsbU (regulator of sigma subunit)